MATGKSKYLQADPSVTAAAAGDAFGGGGGNAELLIAANQLRYSQDLEAANLVQADPSKKDDIDPADLASAADIDEGTILDYAVHGDYVVAVYEGADGRTGKLVFEYDGDGGVELLESEETPELAALRAQVEAQSAVQDAQKQAEQIIAEAREKAAQITAEAGQKQQEEAFKKGEESEDPEAAEEAAVPVAAPQRFSAETPDLAAGGDGGSGSEAATDADYQSKDADELADLVNERGLEVEGTGARGRRVKADYIKALQEADRKDPASRPGADTAEDDGDPPTSVEETRDDEHVAQ